MAPNQLLTRKHALRAGLLLVGLAYFQIFSQLEVSPFLRNFLILMPVQVAALLYVGYRYLAKPDSTHL